MPLSPRNILFPPKKSSVSSSLPTTLETPPSNSTDLTLLFKHTTHTILLLLDTQTPIPNILTQLLLILQDRYPDGLNPLNPSPTSKKTPIPESIEDIRLGVPKDIYEPSKGWTELHVGVGDTPSSMGLKDGSLVAFRFESEDEEEEGSGEFEVKFPSYAEEYGEEEAGEGEEMEEEE
ncbi:Kinesin 6 protein [Rutstroemia sp. NJR-2017a WRK4]|nr:Kinesin 6 protein [Rutstroemia sp. NJR-2017a WRK4]